MSIRPQLQLHFLNRIFYAVVKIEPQILSGWFLVSEPVLYLDYDRISILIPIRKVRLIRFFGENRSFCPANRVFWGSVEVYWLAMYDMCWRASNDTRRNSILPESLKNTRKEAANMCTSSDDSPCSSALHARLHLTGICSELEKQRQVTLTVVDPTWRRFWLYLSLSCLMGSARQSSALLRFWTDYTQIKCMVFRLIMSYSPSYAFMYHGRVWSSSRSR